MSYLLVKHLHITFVSATIVFFCLRLYWSVTGAESIKRKWVKITPHIIDTLLLSCAVYLLVLLRLSPLEHSWILAKLVALVVYILLGTVAIKRGKTPKIRLFAGIAAIAVFAYMVLVAISHSPCAGLVNC